MRASPDHVQQFVRAARLRWMLWRIVERIGIGLLIGCPLAFILSLLLLWRGESAVSLVVGIFALGALLGLTVGILSRPSLLETAMEADRQLNLHDLLGTAIQLQNSRYLDDAWRENFRSLAEARVRSISPSQLVLNRLGARAWGGIGLSAALVMTVALMTTMPSESMARLDRAQNLESFEVTEKPSAKSNLAPVASRSGSQRGDAAPEATSRSAHSIDASRAHDSVPGDATHATNPTGDGAGDGAGQTEASSRPPSLDLAAAPGAPDAHGDTVASGTGSSAPDGSGESAHPAVARTPAYRSLPPWQSSSWPADRDAAMQSLRTGKIPDRYRDLVREYFSRQPN